MDQIMLHEGSSDEGSSSISDDSWISGFVNKPGYELLAKVPREFITENCNLIHLNTAVDDFATCRDIILDNVHMVETCTNPRNVAKLYALIHARYINSIHGINEMALRYEYSDFGNCPRFYCENQSVLPIGLGEQYGDSFVKIYCPRCTDVYEPVARFSKLDGAFFGTNFPHMFFMTFPHFRPMPSTKSYEPSLYGFKIVKSAYEPLPDPSIGQDKENTNPNQVLVEDENPVDKDKAQ